MHSSREMYSESLTTEKGGLNHAIEYVSTEAINPWELFGFHEVTLLRVEVVLQVHLNSLLPGKVHKSRILQNNSNLQKRDLANYSATNAPVLPSSVFIHNKVKA